MTSLKRINTQSFQPWTKFMLIQSLAWSHISSHVPEHHMCKKVKYLASYFIKTFNVLKCLLLSVARVTSGPLRQTG